MASGVIQADSQPAVLGMAARRAMTGFRPDIEGLRAIAVSLVVLFHAGIAGFGGGFVGVDVFFAISGYLIVPHLVAEIETKGRVDLGAFYARRFRRLLPGAAAMIVGVLVVSLLMVSAFEQQHYLGTAIATSLYVSNFWFVLKAGDYFGAANELNPFLHTWSLAVEEQFYVIMPPLLILAYRLAARRGIVWLLVGLSALTYAACIYLTTHAPAFGFFGSPARIWEFGLGALAGLVQVGAGRDRRLWAELLGWAGLAIILASASLLLTNQTTFPGAVAGLPVIGVVALMLAGRMDGAASFNRLLSLAPVQWLGARSYSWYLWHWPVLVFAAKLQPDMPLAWRIGCLIVSLALGALSYGLFENPLRFAVWLTRSRRLTLVLAACVTVALAGASFAAKRFADGPGRTQADRIAAIAANEAPPGACALTPIAPGLRECALGDAAAPKLVVLLGDSHAEQWISPLLGMALRDHFRLVVLARYSCPIADLPPVYVSTLRRRVPECPQWRKAAIARAIALRPSVLIVTTSQHYVDAPERGGTIGGEGAVGQVSLADWQAGLTRTLAALRPSGATMIYLRDTPHPPFDVPMCIARTSVPIAAARSDCRIATKAALPPSLWLAESAAAAVNGVRTIDIDGRLCGPQTCPTVIGGVVAYRDGSHLSERLSRQMQPDLERALAPVLAPAIIAR